MFNMSGCFSWVVLCIHCILVTASPSLSRSSSDVHYGVVLDAGSSGTKIKAYRWRATATLSKLPRIELIQGSNLKFRPGIGYFVRHPEQLRNYLSDVINRVRELVPRNVTKTTPLYLMATAGARILDPDIALELMNKIRNYLDNSTANPFMFTRKHVRVLSGEEEGVYAWISVNSLTGFFDSVRAPNQSAGVLEMGGGSTQIAFVPSVPLYAGEFQVHLVARRFDLYVHSYLTYGSDYMLRKVNSLLTRGRDEADVVFSPCMLKGDTQTFKDDSGKTFQLQGNGSSSRCAQHIRHFLRKAEDSMCHPKPCALGSVYQPPVGNMTFYATQGFVYTLQNLNVLEEDRILNISKLRYISSQYCNETFERAILQPGIDRKYASDECFMSVYIPLLLTEVYGVNDDNNVLIVTNRVDDTRTEWTLGVMLYEQSMQFQSERLTMIGQESCVSANEKLSNENATGDVPVNIGYTVEPETFVSASIANRADVVSNNVLVFIFTSAVLLKFCTDY